MMTLSIAIPTFNRPKQLARTLDVILPQLRPGVDLCVVDNCSTEPVRAVVEAAMAGVNGNSLRYHRNSVNIGLVGNVLRCFEHATGDYVWVLGDDDKPEERAVDRILEAVRNHPDATLLNFASTWSGRREADVVCRGIEDYALKVSSLHNQLFISTQVHRRSSYIEWMRFGYQGIYSMGGFLVPAWIVLAKGGVAVLLKDNLVQYQAPDGSGWHSFPIVMGLMTLTDAPLGLSRDGFTALTKMIGTHIPGDGLLLRQFLRGTVAMPLHQRRLLYRRLIHMARAGRKWTPKAVCVHAVTCAVLASPLWLLERLCRRFQPPADAVGHAETMKRL